MHGPGPRRPVLHTAPLGHAHPHLVECSAACEGRCSRCSGATCTVQGPRQGRRSHGSSVTRHAPPADRTCTTALVLGAVPGSLCVGNAQCLACASPARVRSTAPMQARTLPWDEHRRHAPGQHGRQLLHYVLYKPGPASPGRPVAPLKDNKPMAPTRT